MNKTCFLFSISFLPIKSVLVINTGKVFLASGKGNLHKNPIPFVPLFEILAIAFSKPLFERSFLSLEPDIPIFLFYLKLLNYGGLFIQIN